jgi:hypothetical protein
MDLSKNCHGARLLFLREMGGAHKGLSKEKVVGTLAMRIAAGS